MDLLLKDSTKVAIGGISGEGNWSSGVRMEEESSRGQNLLDVVKSRFYSRLPGERGRVASQGISERLENNGGMRKKMAVKVDESEKTLEILEGGRKRILTDGINVRGEGSDAGGSDGVTQEGERGLGKNTLGEIDQKAISLENVENRGQVGEVSGEIWTSHQNIV